MDAEMFVTVLLKKEIPHRAALRSLLDKSSPPSKAHPWTPSSREEVRLCQVPSGCRGQYLRTVRGETRMPSLRESSSATRSSPQVMFSLTMRAMIWRMSLGSAGRPPRDFQRQYRLKPLRCQRTNVPG